MLTKEILMAVQGHVDKMSKPVAFVLAQGEHSKRAELVDFLDNLASLSDLISVEVRETVAELGSAISFGIEADGQMNGIVFSGIPGGHEFNSLILALLHSGGVDMKLDESIQQMVASINEPMKFEVFVSLSCHNCPDVVQSLNQFAILNPNISTEMIDGGLFPSVIKERDIQGVPSVYLNGELFANGKVDTAMLVDKIIELKPRTQEAAPAKGLPVQDVVVVGGGPAGVASAIYSARKGLKVTIVADRVGGQVKDTMGIENLISIPKTTGPELTNALAAHMQEYEITVREHLRVAEVETGRIKTLTLSSGEVLKAKSLIVATGAKWRELGVPGEKENIGNGVAYCPHCDGPFFKGKNVIVVGGGNSGIEAALDLAGIVKSVTVMEFMPELKADKVLVDQAEARSNISILKNVATEEIIATNGKVSAVKYLNRESNESSTLLMDGVFVQIGLVPNSAFVKNVLELTKYGEIVVDERCHTSEDGVFACGDVTTVPYKQIVIAMGEGAKASLSAFDYLLKHHCEDHVEEPLAEAS